MGYRLWAEVGKAQNGQQEGQRTTYLLCSTNSLFEGKRERERARERERGCHSACSLLVLYCFQPEAYSCPVASKLSPVPGLGEEGLSVGALSLQGDSHCHHPGVRVMADIQCPPDTKQPPNITSCLSLPPLASASLNTTKYSWVSQAR